MSSAWGDSWGSSWGSSWDIGVVPPYIPTDGPWLFLTPFSVKATPAGQPLPFATLTFYRSGTTQLIPVYDGSDLTTELDNPVTADAEGVWPDIWLAETYDYRVLLNERSGVLQYDVDPYLPYAQGAFKYLDARIRATTDGAIVPGATLTFAADGAPAHIWADATLTAALTNPVKADAGGLFPPIYLAGGESYGVTGWIEGEFPPVGPFEFIAGLDIRPGYVDGSGYDVAGVGELISNGTGYGINVFRSSFGYGDLLIVSTALHAAVAADPSAFTFTLVGPTVDAAFNGSDADLGTPGELSWLSIGSMTVGETYTFEVIQA